MIVNKFLFCPQHLGELYHGLYLWPKLQLTLLYTYALPSATALTGTTCMRAGLHSTKDTLAYLHRSSAMDPVTIVGLVEGSIGLAVKCGSVAKSLNSLVGQYKYAKLTVSTMVQNLDIMQLAWDRIGAWSKDYMPTDSEDFTQRLERSLETGSLVLDALEEDLQSYDVSSMTFGQRSRLVWNETTLQGHQSRIQSMSLLLQAIQL